MINPDFNKLSQPFSDTVKGSDSEICWREFLLCNYNFINHCSYRIKEDELSMLISSLSTWIKNGNFTQHKIYDTTKNIMVEEEINVGDICFADLGINFKPECSYAHPVLVVEKVDNLLVVVPTSTNRDKINIAYNFNDNSGKWFYVKADKSNGFNGECALLLNNLKTISKGRIIQKKGIIDNGNFKEGSLFYNIKELLFKNYFPKHNIRLYNTTKLLSEKESKIIELQNKIDELSKELDIVKSEIIKSDIKNNE